MNCVIQIIVIISIVGKIICLDESTEVSVRKVHFPDEYSEDYEYGEIQLPKVPDSSFHIDSAEHLCANSTMSFCEDVKNEAYPIKYTETILAKIDTQTYQKYFNKTTSNETFTLRLLPIDKSAEQCDTIQSVIRPRLAKNDKHDWRFVINQPSFQQRVDVEICQNKNSKCKYKVAFPDGFVSACTQIYRKTQLLSLSVDGELISYDYEFPSHCECKPHRKQNKTMKKSKTKTKTSKTTKRAGGEKRRRIKTPIPL